MIRYVLVGLVLFIGFAVSFAPATLLKPLIENNTQARLSALRGSVWQGQAQLQVKQIALGQLDWDLQIASILQASPRYNWSLDRQGWQLTGIAGADFNNLRITANGAVQASAVNEWLSAYDITLSGSFDIINLMLAADHNGAVLSQVDGQIYWSGGRVRYILSGLLSETTLPEMTAYLNLNAQGMPQAIVYAQENESPLLIASQGSEGFIKIGITKLLTKMLGKPWPGSDPDHAIVLEIEEQVF